MTMEAEVKSGRLSILMAKRPSLAVLTLVFLALAGLVGVSGPRSVRSQALDSTLTPVDTQAACCLSDTFIAVAERAEPGVVSITTVQKSASQNSGGTDNDVLDEFFRRFFEGKTDNGYRNPNESLLPSVDSDSLVTAAGAGTIVRRSGDDFYILTNYHVVEDAYRVTVRLSDETTLRGTVVGIDPVTDLAVVKISSPKLSDRNVVPIGDSSKVQVGSWALAMGSPFGFDKTLTVGIVSALHRELRDEETDYTDLIQTDAAINKGNSGGPLLDIEGRVIGVNAAIASPTGSFIGLGFAVPINTAKDILDELISEGRVVRGWLGVGIQDLTPVLQEYYGVREGVLVASIDLKGPSHTAGIQEEDIIVRIDQTPVNDVRSLQRLVARTRPGTSVLVTLVRAGKSQSVRVRVGTSPSTPPGRPPAQFGAIGPGLRVRTLTEAIARQVGAGRVQGVVVVGVTPGSPAEEAGMEVGDVITSINSKPVSNAEDFNSALSAIRSGGIVVLRVIRDGMPRMIGFRVE